MRKTVTFIVVTRGIRNQMLMICTPSFVIEIYKNKNRKYNPINPGAAYLIPLVASKSILIWMIVKSLMYAVIILGITVTS